VFFSAELSTEVIMDRLLSPYSSVERWKITGRHLTGELFSRLVQTGDALSHYKLYINDRARTAAEIKTACRAIARENNHKIDLILVDYLQRLEYPFGITNQNQGITALMKELAPLAGEYDAAVVALSQFNREHEKRSDPTPRKSDLRGCGEIEEYARTILALYDPDEGKPKRAIKVACLKQGEGETFNGIDLVYDTDFMTFGGRFPLFSPVENDFYL
jgi:replicative DNA helicase